MQDMTFACEIRGDKRIAKADRGKGVPPAEAMSIAPQPSDDVALQFTSALRSAFTASTFPEPAAQRRGVPVLDSASLSAPASSSFLTTSPDPESLGFCHALMYI